MERNYPILKKYRKMYYKGQFKIKVELENCIVRPGLFSQQELVNYIYNTFIIIMFFSGSEHLTPYIIDA
jgi:hypothetical protein